MHLFDDFFGQTLDLLFIHIWVFDFEQRFGDDLGEDFVLFGRSSLELLDIEDVVSYTQDLGDISGHGDVVACDHLHFHSLGFGLFDRLFGVFSRRVVEWDESYEVKLILVTLFESHAKGTKSIFGELFDLVVDGLLVDLFGIGKCQDHLRSSFDGYQTLSILGLDHRFGTLAHWIEGDELRHFVVGGEFTDPVLVRILEDRFFYGVVVLSFTGQDGIQEKLRYIVTFYDKRIGDRHLVFGECPGLVRAEHIHSRHLLDGCQATDDRLALGQIQSPYGHRDGKDRWQCYRDGRDGEYQ